MGDGADSRLEAVVRKWRAGRPLAEDESGTLCATLLALLTFGQQLGAVNAATVAPRERQ